MQESNGETKGLEGTVGRGRPSWEKGVVGDLATHHPLALAWWLLHMGSHACGGVLETGCRRGFCRRVDQATTNPMVGLLVGMEQLPEKFTGEFFRH